MQSRSQRCSRTSMDQSALRRPEPAEVRERRTEAGKQNGSLTSSLGRLSRTGPAGSSSAGTQLSQERPQSLQQETADQDAGHFLSEAEST